MTREETIRIMREVCDKDKVDAWHDGFWVITQEELERLVARVEVEEREACAKLCDARVGIWLIPAGPKECADAIRARGNQ